MAANQANGTEVLSGETNQTEQASPDGNASNAVRRSELPNGNSERIKVPLFVVNDITELIPNPRAREYAQRRSPHLLALILWESHRYASAEWASNNWDLFCAGCKNGFDIEEALAQPPVVTVPESGPVTVPVSLFNALMDIRELDRTWGRQPETDPYELLDSVMKWAGRLHEPYRWAIENWAEFSRGCKDGFQLSDEDEALMRR